MNSQQSISLEDQTADTLRHWDRLRTDPATFGVTQTELHEESNVIRLSILLVEDQDGGADVRLCHLTSMLPSTSDDQGTLQPNYGLYTEGAGLLALLHFNQRDTSIVPDLGRLRNTCNVQLTMSFGNTQFSPIEACRVLAHEVDPIDRPHSLEQPHPISLVGATRSAVTGPLSTLASVFELPVVSYGSTSSQLNSRASYPYFGRTVPTNQGDAIAAAQYFRQVLGVTHMGTFFIKDGFGSAFHKEFVSAAKNTLNPPMTMLSVPYDPNGSEEEIRRAVQQLKDSGYEFFYGIISTPTYNTVMRQAHAVGVAGHPGKTWILSGDSGQILGTDYAYDAATEGDLAAATSGMGVISLNIPHNQAFDEAWSMLEGNRAIKDYFVQKHSPLLNFSEFQFYDAPTYWDYLQYDAVMALGFAACEAQQEFFTGSQLFDSMMKTLFRGASGVVEFDANTGTRKTSSLAYKVTNVVARPPDANGKIYFDTADTRIQDPSLNNSWILIPGAPAYVYSDGTTTAPPALPLLEENQNLIGVGILVTGLVLGIMCVVLSALSAAWVRLYRDSQAARMAQPFFLFIICLGTFLMALAVIPMSFQEPMPKAVLDAGCMSIPWLFSSGFVIAFSALLSKTLRIYQLMQGGKSFRRVVVAASDVMRPFLVLGTLNVSLLVAWTIASPLRWTRVELQNYDEFGRNTDSYGSCQSENETLQHAFAWPIVAVDLIALVLANVYNYRARTISDKLHEAGSIALSLAIMLEAALIGIPAMLVVEQNPSAYFLIRSVLVSIVCGAILLPMFIPKWQATLLKDESETRPAGGMRANMMSTVFISPQQHGGTVAAIRSVALESRMSGLGSSRGNFQYPATGAASGLAAGTSANLSGNFGAKYENGGTDKGSVGFTTNEVPTWTESSVIPEGPISAGEMSASDSEQTESRQGEESDPESIAQVEESGSEDIFVDEPEDEAGTGSSTGMDDYYDNMYFL
ncbi:Metabotropic glutamate receptor-like protein E [Seminavis robusta]|uniref:Metabotropic glutamate receptor-like protein E n=1 Tax=Seminavis robusta TaxID=568900 RepID=A0A9N8HRF1_9STRA|nr:Metabotropic glutamate receptor-like protein E [Seminavis robusta]|eukprot:Sro1390_g268610.1 Metabotropic glutamate receptor-like protein E (972) ;mRNA; f:2488-5637